MPRPTAATPAPLKRPLVSIINDPDDLQAYPLPPEPSDSYLETLASADASLYATAMPSVSATTATRRRGKIRGPVYIPELTAYLKGKSPDGSDAKDDDEAERIELGLAEGTNLIRRKRGWGGELNENAVDLAFTVLGLQDPFELDNFDHLKQQMLIALVACSPRLVAPTVIEQYFHHQYSISQRHTMLTALALAARELAGFPAPTSDKLSLNHTPTTSSAGPEIELFPSKRLPPHLHSRLIASDSPDAAIKSTPRGALESITDELTRSALSDAREDAEVSIPEAAREKLLTVRRFASAKTKDAAKIQLVNQASSTFEDYKSIATEFFIMPLINNFWLFLRDTASSPTRDRGGYVGGAGTASLLEPISLTKFLSTLSILVHSARNSAHFLAVLAPEAIELVLALRTSIEESNEQVLTTEMELLLVVFDSTVAQDYGRSLLNNVSKGAQLIGDVKEWAEEVFEYEERKESVGRGGVGPTGRAAAGVLLRIDEVLSRWRGTVGW